LFPTSCTATPQAAALCSGAGQQAAGGLAAKAAREAAKKAGKRAIGPAVGVAMLGGLCSVDDDDSADGLDKLNEVLNDIPDEAKPVSTPATPPTGPDDDDPFGEDDTSDLKYEASPKHHINASSNSKGKVSASPTNGQSALSRSIRLNQNTSRRLAVDKKNNEIIIFDETHPGTGIYHGHVRVWSQLSNAQQAALRAANLVNKRGKIK